MNLNQDFLDLLGLLNDENCESLPWTSYIFTRHKSPLLMTRPLLRKRLPSRRV